jgi:ABC-type taurine transport system ATPase subunit
MSGQRRFHVEYSIAPRWHTRSCVDPELILSDEPISALDALARIRMHRLLLDLCSRHHPAVRRHG